MPWVHAQRCLQLSLAHFGTMPPSYLLLVTCYFALATARRGGGGSYGRGGGSYGRGGGSYSSGHTYPSSHGLSGTGYSANSHHSSSNTHTYPQSTGYSGNNHRSTSYTHRSEVHNHYHYSPPQHISYGSQQHPVFTGTPPSYVYVYKNSGSRYDNLLTGLALYNLGRMSNSHGHYGHNDYNRNSYEYRGAPGEVCKLAISKSNGEYEETRIDCKLISSFIWEAGSENKPVSTVIKTVNVTQTVKDGNGSVSFSNTTVEAVQVKGKSIQVDSGMTCFLIRIARESSLKKNVECGLLQEYATRSLRYNPYTGGCSRYVPVIPTLLSSFIVLHLISQSFIYIIACEN